MLYLYTWIILDMLANTINVLFIITAAGENAVLPLVLFLPATMRVVLGIE